MKLHLQCVTIKFTSFGKLVAISLINLLFDYLKSAFAMKNDLGSKQK